MNSTTKTFSSSSSSLSSSPPPANSVIPNANSSPSRFHNVTTDNNNKPATLEAREHCNEPNRLEAPDQRLQDEPKPLQHPSREEKELETADELQREARRNELTSQPVDQVQDGSKLTKNAKQAPASKTEQESETDDESKADNSKSVSFDEMPNNDNNISNNSDNNNTAEQTSQQEDQEGSSFDDYLDASMDEAPPDEPDRPEAAGLQQEAISNNTINRRSFLMNSFSHSKNNNNNSSSSNRLAALISHRPLTNELRKFTKNSGVLKAIEKRRLRQRERLKARNKSNHDTSNNKQSPGRAKLGSNKKRDLLYQAAVAQTRQGLTSTTTLGPGNSLLALNGANNHSHHSHNLSLKANALKHLPSLASGSTQISSAIQRLISSKLGITPANSDLMLNHNNHQQQNNNNHNNHTIFDHLTGKKLASLFEGHDQQLLQLANQHHQDEGDFSSTSASDHQHHSLMPAGANFAGPAHHFDVPGSEGHEMDEPEQLDGDRLAELMSQWPANEGSPNENQAASTSSLLSLQAAHRHNKLGNSYGSSLSLQSRPSPALGGANGGGHRGGGGGQGGGGGGSPPDKQVIPIEIIGLDPSVTNSILYGQSPVNQNQQAQQPQSQRHSQRYQSQFVSGASGGGLEDASNSLTNGQGSHQVVSASELDIQENPLLPGSVQDGHKYEASSLDQPNQRPAADMTALGDGANQEGAGPPASVLHIHHFHHTTEPGADQQQAMKQQSMESGELDANRQQQLGELGADLRQQTDQGPTESPNVATSGKSDSSSASNESQLALKGAADQATSLAPGEVGEPQVASEQQAPNEEDKSAAKRFVTRNSLRDKAQADPDEANSNQARNPLVVQKASTMSAGQTVTRPEPINNSRLNHSVPFLVQADSSQRFMPIRSPMVSGHGNEQASDATGGEGGHSNNMLMVAYRPAGRVPSLANHQLDDGASLGDTSIVQRYQQRQPPRQQQQHYGDYWPTSAMESHNNNNNLNQTLMWNGIDGGPSQAHYQTPTRHLLLPYNEGSESSQLLSSTALAQQQQQQRQRLAGGGATQFNNSTLRSQLPSISTSQLAALLKRPKLNQSLLMQLQEQLASPTIAIDSANALEPNWTNEDDRLLAQYNGLANSRNSRHQQPKVISTSGQYSKNLTHGNQNPFQNHYQNFVENLVLMKQMKQKEEEAQQLQALLHNNHQSGSSNNKELPANRQLTSRLTNNELAMVMQDQLSKQMHNRTHSGGDNHHHLNATSAGRYELTSASDRAPAKLLRDQQQQQVANSNVPRSRRPNSQTFSANENFHVPNTSQSNHNNDKLPPASVITTDKHLMDRLSNSNNNLIATTTTHDSGLGIASSGELDATRFAKTGFNVTARPTLSQGPGGSSSSSPPGRDSFIDSTEGVSNLALAFIFVVSLLTFLMIAASMVYRRRRSVRATRCNGGSSTGSMPASDLSTGGVGPSSRSSGRFNIAQRTRHLMSSNMFAGVMQTKAKRSADCGGGLSGGQTTNSSSSLTSITHLGAAPRNELQPPPLPSTSIGQNIKSNHHHRLTATKSAWSKHLKPVLKGPDVARCQQAVASVVHQQHNLNVADSTYVNKYVRGSNAINHNNKEPPIASHQANLDKYQSTDETTTSTNEGTLVSHPDSDIRTLNTRLQKATYMQQLRASQESPAKQQQQGGGGGLHYKKHQQSNATAVSPPGQARPSSRPASALGQNLRPKSGKSSPVVDQVDPYTPRRAMML